VTETKTRTRMKVLAAFVVFMFGALTTRLWFLQVLATDEFSALADQNQVRLVPIAPLRGQIVDRHGKVLVGNRPTRVVTVDRGQIKGREDEVLFRLSELLGVPVEDMLARLNSKKYHPLEPVPVAEDVDQQVIFFIKEHQDEFPGIGYAVDATREYPSKSLAAHVLGYTGEVSQEQLELEQFAGYRPGAMVGKAGIESVYERYLQGEPGTRGIRVTAKGRVLDDNFGSQPATPGDNVVLSIDAKVQETAERSLALGIKLARGIYHAESGRNLRGSGGAVVVMDPRNGQVLALASNPTYDPSVFLGGLTRKEFAPLNDPENNYPLLNRAIQSGYPPGSTFKPFVAAAALKEGIARMDGYYPCPPSYVIPGDAAQRPFRNWSSRDYGHISVAQSLAISCDTVYYPMGWQFSLKYFRSDQTDEVFQNYLRRMGFGLPTGIDLPSEISGVVPTQEYKKNLFLSNPKVFCQSGKKDGCETDYRWYPGDYVNLSIGQGFMQTTPLQLAVAYSAIANGGTLWEPRLALRVEAPDGKVVQRNQPTERGRLPVNKAITNYIRDALKGVVEGTGTASSAFDGFPLSQIPVAGKTGTADIIPKQPFSWFAAMAPADNPKYVVVAMVEQGGHGSTTAAPVVRRILEGLFNLESTDLHAGESVD
jgi:penicillin-binding protein 2